jgi:hypothetical protein
VADFSANPALVTDAALSAVPAGIIGARALARQLACASFIIVHAAGRIQRGDPSR